MGLPAKRRGGVPDISGLRESVSFGGLPSSLCAEWWSAGRLGRPIFRAKFHALAGLAKPVLHYSGDPAAKLEHSGINVCRGWQSILVSYLVGIF